MNNVRNSELISAPHITQAQQQHKYCCVCGCNSDASYGLGIRFHSITKDSVHSELTIEARHQGYEGLLHGGIASALLDGAMTHCLLQQNITALTAELTVKFHHPIAMGDSVDIMANLKQIRRGIYYIDGQLTVKGKCCVSATAKFLVPK